VQARFSTIDSPHLFKHFIPKQCQLSNPINFIEQSSLTLDEGVHHQRLQHELEGVALFREALPLFL
jgi:hypothetical protein